MEIPENLLKVLPAVGDSPFAYSILILFMISSITTTFLIKKRPNVKNSTIAIIACSIIAVAITPFIYNVVLGSQNARALKSSMEAKHVSIRKQIEEVTDYYVQKINEKNTRNQKDINYIYTSLISFQNEVDEHYNAQQKAIDENDWSSFHEHGVQIELAIERYQSLIAIAKQQEQKSKSRSKKYDIPEKIESIFGSTRALNQADIDSLPDLKSIESKPWQIDEMTHEISPEDTVKNIQNDMRH